MLQQMMTSREFSEQIAYYLDHRWGDDWLQAGTVAAAAASSHPYLKRPPQVQQFMPKTRGPQRQQSVKEMGRILTMNTRAIQAMTNG